MKTKTTKADLLKILLKHSRNQGDYIPDYEYDKLIVDIIKYFKGQGK